MLVWFAHCPQHTIVSRLQHAPVRVFGVFCGVVCAMCLYTYHMSCSPHSLIFSLSHTQTHTQSQTHIILGVGHVRHMLHHLLVYQLKPQCTSHLHHILQRQLKGQLTPLYICMTVCPVVEQGAHVDPVAPFLLGGNERGGDVQNMTMMTTP